MFQKKAFFKILKRKKNKYIFFYWGASAYLSMLIEIFRVDIGNTKN